MAIRVYLSALTLVFLFLTVISGDIGLLEAVIVTCALVYLILDAREHLQLVKAQFEELQQIEKRLSEILR